MDLARVPPPQAAAGGKIVACDVDRAGRLACIVERPDGRRVVVMDGLACPAPDYVARGLRHVAWLSDAAALVWPAFSPAGERDAAYGCAVVSAREFHLAPFGSPDRAFASDGYIFGAYGEHRVLGEAVGPYDDDLATVFDGATGERLFGAHDLMTDAADPFFTELSCGCAADGRLTFLADGSPGLWALDARARTIDYVDVVMAVDAPADALSVCGDEVRLLWLGGENVRIRRIDRLAGTERDKTAGAAPGVCAGTQARGLPDGGFLLWSETNVATLSV